MLFFMVLLIFCNLTFVTSTNARSALFSRAKLDWNCWDVEDIAKLRARREFERVIPPAVKPEEVNTRYIRRTVRYFRNALMVVQKGVDQQTAEILKDALCDTIGAHMYSEILPTVRFAYYAGYIPYRSARHAHNLLEQIKILLNTHGVGWRRPPRNPVWSNMTVAKIGIGTSSLIDPCAILITRRDSHNCIHIPTPKVDNERNPSAMVFPFKRQNLISLTSPVSENIFLRYYTSVSKCILNKSPTNCRHSDFINFNNELWYWMKRDIAPHLLDDKLYVAFSGILRVAAAVQTYGKGLSRRNLFEYHSEVQPIWKPWRKLNRSYVQINTDWTPALYVALVILTAIAICLLQVCYNYMFGEAKTCLCTATPQGPGSKGIAYTNVCSSTESAGHPQRSVISTVCYGSQNQTMCPRKSPSAGSIKTQRVYDLNENTEKVMTIILSGNEDSETETSKIETDEHAKTTDIKNSGSKPKSPPKLDTTIAQLTPEKTIKTDRSAKNIAKPMYSTSTLTRTDVTFCPRGSESTWSGTSSTTSDKSGTSTSSKSHSQRSRSSRNLAWARHVISRHSRRISQYSGTEIDGKTYSTQTSTRR